MWQNYSFAIIFNRKSTQSEQKSDAFATNNGALVNYRHLQFANV